MTKPSPDRLRVLWEKSRNYLTSFYTELETVRNEFGNDKEFASWCLMDLHIGVDVLVASTGFLRPTDARIAKRELALAREADKEARRIAKQQKKAQAAAERAQAAAEKARQEKETKEERKKKNAKNRYKRSKAELAAFYEHSVPKGNGHLNGCSIDISNDEVLATEIKKAMSKLDKSRAEWVEASIELASLLSWGKARYPATNEFGDWLDRHEINIGYQDRAALLNLGKNLEAMRLKLVRTERSSYRHIWLEVQKEVRLCLSA
jgi:hypothetical protein